MSRSKVFLRVLVCYLHPITILAIFVGGPLSILLFR